MFLSYDTSRTAVNMTNAMTRQAAAVASSFTAVNSNRNIETATEAAICAYLGSVNSNSTKQRVY